MDLYVFSKFTEYFLNLPTFCFSFLFFGSYLDMLSPPLQEQVYHTSSRDGAQNVASCSVLVANDCRVVLTFQVKSFFNVHLLPHWQAQAVSNTITSPGMPANVRTSQTHTTWTLTTVELVRGLMCSPKENPVKQRCSSIAFDFLDLSSSNLVHDSSVDLWDNRSKNTLGWPPSLKSEACSTMPCISLVL